VAVVETLVQVLTKMVVEEELVVIELVVMVHVH
jgi:hypothetical protein